MKIIFTANEYVTESNFAGGIANYLYKITHFLKAEGHEPIIVVASKKNEVIFHEDVEVHRVKLKKSKLFFYFNRVTFQKFKPASLWYQLSCNFKHEILKIHNKKPIDIVQYASYPATGICKIKNIPSVVRISSIQKLWNNADNTFRKTFVEQQRELLERRMFRKADNIFGPSNLLAKKIEADTGKKVKIIRTPYFAKKKELDYSEYEKVKEIVIENRYLLFFGSLKPMKGIEEISEILEKLLEENKNLYFVFVGNNLKMFNQKFSFDFITEKAGKHKNRVILIESLPHNKLYPIITKSYAVVLPSRIDNIPNTALETVSLKKLLISTKNSSIDELIEHKKSGLLAENKNSKSLLETINLALQLSEQDKSKMETEAYNQLQNFDAKIIVPQLLEHYQNIINAKK